MRKPSCGKGLRILCGVLLLLMLTLAGAGSALAGPASSGSVKTVPDAYMQTADTIEIAGQPLRILVGADGSHQVYHEKYTRGATYGAAGSGFYIALGQTVYGPYYTSTTPIRQEGPSGSGTSGSPYQVVTEQQIGDRGSEIQVVQTVSYVNGNNYFQLDWRISNTGNSRTCFKAYHAADLYFADSDYGIGFYDSQSGAVGGFNQDRNWFMAFIPSVQASHYEEAYYSTIWERVSTAADLQDSIDTNYIDNGAALQWDLCLGGGQSTTIGDRWSFGLSQAEVIQPGASVEAFRQPGPLTPAITTHIPTPLDISIDPKVIGTNMLLAAIAMLLFTVASEILNRTLAKNEPFMQRLLKPLTWVRSQAERLSIGKRLGRPAWFEILKLVLVMLIYGFVFSLLDPSWKPFSLTGLTLFVTMVLAYGFVGLADDIVQWAVARRRKLPSSLTVRPGNLLIIVASTAFSRVFGILPGIMFGAPEAFDIDEAALKDRRTENSLLRVAAGVLFVILLLAWVPTIFTGLIQRVNLPNFLLVLTGGLESFLLLVFAVTVQNIFLQMLALPNTFGHALARWNKLAWAVGLMAATFLFLHTLLNPQGDLAKALASTNVLVFMVTIFLFLVFTVLVWLFFKILHAATRGPTITPTGYPMPANSNSWVWFMVGGLVVVCLCLAVLAGIAVIALRK